ncbi:hypothetical protein A2U01_0103831, partial [Trifolium medium]|nr:hypothetical protein [Trifolium medium]
MDIPLIFNAFKNLIQEKSIISMVIHDTHSVGYVKEQNDSESSKLLFTPEQHKALLALLQ